MNLSRGSTAIASDADMECDVELSEVHGKKIDDGTGINIYYILDHDNTKVYDIPQNFIAKAFFNGDPVYYFKGICIKCRKKQFPSILSKNHHQEVFSFTMCHLCFLSSTPNIPHIQGYGDEIFRKHSFSPKMMYFDLVSTMNNPKRDELISERAKEARVHVQANAKRWRDLERWNIMQTLARGYGVMGKKCKYVSWGIGKSFNEYFGELNEKNQPQGPGVMCYNDGGMYVGPWADGKRHSTSTPGYFVKIDGFEYEGQYIHDMKHGFGQSKYPDGTTYRGEFARDFEHGDGTLIYASNSKLGLRYEGKFRFGKRDGHGVLTKLDGSKIKDVFRDPFGYYSEKPIPKIIENDLSTDNEEEKANIVFIQPDSLFQCANRALADTIKLKRHLTPPLKMRKCLPEHLKHRVASVYLSIRTPFPSAEFVDAILPYAFTLVESIQISSIRIGTMDMDTLLYFQSSNYKLRKLELVATSLSSTSLEVLNLQIASVPSIECKEDKWPKLEELNLSYNSMSLATIQGLMKVIEVKKSIKVLNISGVNMNTLGCLALSKMLQNNSTLLELDVSFNNIGEEGGELLAQAIKDNVTLVKLNVRHNYIRSVGGVAFANVLLYNRTLRVLCLLDNNIGKENMTLISSRLNGTMKDLLESVRGRNFQIPSQYIFRKSNTGLVDI